MFEEILNTKNKTKINFANTQNEKAYFLGEYKERVIAALNKDQLIEDGFYPEIEVALKHKEAKIMKISRDIPFNKIKIYVKKAEKLNVRYLLVDGISYRGNIGLIVASDECLSENIENPIIRDMDEDFTEAGLGENFSKAIGKKICSDCYGEIDQKLPEKKELFIKKSFMDRFFGAKCPICKK